LIPPTNYVLGIKLIGVKFLL